MPSYCLIISVLAQTPVLIWLDTPRKQDASAASQDVESKVGIPILEEWSAESIR